MLISILGTFISVSSTNWFTAWIGLELNILSFVPLIINNKNTLSSEAAIKYFLIQASASSIFIFLCIYNSYYNFIYFFFNSPALYLVILPLIIKLGASPFHNWFIIVIQRLDWVMCYLLMTLQKIAPLFLINFLFQKSNLILLFALTSLIVGSIGGLNQTSLNKIMAFSSINHLGWILTTNLLNKYILIIYITFYLFMNLFTLQFLYIKTIFNFNQITHNYNFIIWSIRILSLGGLPPFIGFLPKWMVIQMLILNNFNFTCFILITTALITLIFYLRIIISRVIFTSSIQKWILLYNYNVNTSFVIFLSSLTVLGLILYNLFLT